MTKCVIVTAVATGGSAMGSAVATGGLPWVVSMGTSSKFIQYRNSEYSHSMIMQKQFLAETN